MKICRRCQTLLIGLLAVLAANASGQEVDRGQRTNGWPKASLETRHGNPYEEIAAATGGSVIRIDPAQQQDRDPALTAALTAFANERSPLRKRAVVEIASGRQSVGFEVSRSDSPLTINVNGIGRGRIVILRPDGTSVLQSDRSARLRTYGPAGSIGVFLQSATPAVGHWKIIVRAPAEVTIDVMPADTLITGK